MWRKVPHLLLGLAFFVTSAYLLRRPVAGWKSPWQSESLRPTTDSVEAPPENPDVPGAANTKSYGVLSSLIDKVKEGHEGTESASSHRPPLEVDRTHSSNALAPKRLVHRRIALKTFQAFGFEVPPHATRPRIHGTFNSSVGDRGSAEPDENVEVLLLNEEEFRDLAHGRVQAASSVSPPSTGAVIDWALDSTLQPTKYYLVLRNASTGRVTEQVNADFTVSFD